MGQFKGKARRGDRIQTSASCITAANEKGDGGREKLQSRTVKMWLIYTVDSSVLAGRRETAEGRNGRWGEDNYHQHKRK